MKSVSKELIGAFAIPVILSILRNGDTYGYEVMQKVKRMTNNEIKWKEASIYPVLKNMENKGMIKSYWKVQSNERPRKYYTILPYGLKQLEHSKGEVEMVYSLLDQLWNPAT